MIFEARCHSKRVATVACIVLTVLLCVCPTLAAVKKPLDDGEQRAAEARVQLDKENYVSNVMNGEYWLVVFCERDGLNNFDRAMGMMMDLGIRYGWVEPSMEKQVTMAAYYHTQVEQMQIPFAKIFHAPSRLEEFVHWTYVHPFVDKVMHKIPNTVHEVSIDNYKTFFTGEIHKVLVFSGKGTTTPLLKKFGREFKGRLRIGRAVDPTQELAKRLRALYTPFLITCNATTFDEETGKGAAAYGGEPSDIADITKWLHEVALPVGKEVKDELDLLRVGAPVPVTKTNWKQVVEQRTKPTLVAFNGMTQIGDLDDVARYAFMSTRGEAGTTKLDIDVAQVDCLKHKQFCLDMGVEFDPHVRLYHYPVLADETTDFVDGAMDAQGLIDFVRESRGRRKIQVMLPGAIEENAKKRVEWRDEL